MSEHTEKRGFTPKQTFLGGLVAGILVICTIGFFILLGVVLIGDKAESKPLANNGGVVQPTAPEPFVPEDVKPVGENDHKRGAKNAVVTIVEYSDYECPFCTNFHETMKQVLENNDDVNWVYRHYPLSFHASAQPTAEAAECVAELGGNEAFWKFSDAAYEKGGVHSVENIESYAKGAGVDKDKFDDCFEKGKYAGKVRNDLLEGQMSGVEGTPGSFVIGPNGTRMLPGAVPVESIQAAIDSVR